MKNNWLDISYNVKAYKYARWMTYKKLHMRNAWASIYPFHVVSRRRSSLNKRYQAGIIAFLFSICQPQGRAADQSKTRSQKGKSFATLVPFLVISVFPNPSVSSRRRIESTQTKGVWRFSPQTRRHVFPVKLVSSGIQCCQSLINDWQYATWVDILIN